MKSSEQDRRYLEGEADAFFERNFAAAEPQTLRPHKVRITERIDSAGIHPTRVLEYGCGYGDMLHYYAGQGGVAAGIEPSAKSVAFGKRAYGETIELHEGTIADNPINASAAERDPFDLIVVDDVLCWVSRETLFQSIANIDELLADGGHLYIREFLPLQNTRNRNHHVPDTEVYCYKPVGPHYRIFTASGVYEVIWQQVTMDRADQWVAGGRDPFDSRWSEVILRKSMSEFFPTEPPR